MAERPVVGDGEKNVWPLRRLAADDKPVQNKNEAIPRLRNERIRLHVLNSQALAKGKELATENNRTRLATTLRD